MTPLDALELPSRLLSRVLSAVSLARVARSASAEALLDKVTVESALLPPFEVVVPAEDAALDVAAVEAVVAALKRLDRAESELLLTLPIDIMTQTGTLDVSFIGRSSQDLRIAEIGRCGRIRAGETGSGQAPAA